MEKPIEQQTSPAIPTETSFQTSTSARMQAIGPTEQQENPATQREATSPTSKSAAMQIGKRIAQALPPWALKLEALYLQMTPISLLLAQLPNASAFNLEIQDIVVRAIGLNSTTQQSQFLPSKKYTASVVKAFVRLAEDSRAEVHEAFLDSIMNWLNIGDSNSKANNENPCDVPVPNAELCYLTYNIPNDPTDTAVTVNTTPVRIRVSTACNQVGLRVWEAGLLLTEFGITQREFFAGKRVLELGAGSGLTGLAIAAACAQADSNANCQLILSDFDPVVIANMKHNVEVNLPVLLGKSEVSELVSDQQSNVGNTGTVNNPKAINVISTESQCVCEGLSGIDEAITNQSVTNQSNDNELVNSQANDNELGSRQANDNEVINSQANDNELSNSQSNNSKLVKCQPNEIQPIKNERINEQSIDEHFMNKIDNQSSGQIQFDKIDRTEPIKAQQISNQPMTKQTATGIQPITTPTGGTQTLNAKSAKLLQAIDCQPFNNQPIDKEPLNAQSNEFSQSIETVPQALCIDWTKENALDEVLCDGPVDVVIAADCGYDPEVFKGFARVVKDLMKKCDSRVIVATPIRNPETFAEFENTLDSHGLGCSDLSHMMPEDPLFCFESTALLNNNTSRESIKIQELFVVAE